jgi:hypothetical protein
MHIGVYKLLMVKPEEKRPLRRPRRRKVENIKRDLGEIGWGGIEYIIWLRIGASRGLF